MKVMLALLCIVMLLFGGGCALTLGGYGGGALVLIPIAVAVFNGLVLAALFGWSEPWRPAFYILAIADVIVAIGTLIAAFSIATSDQSVLPWGLAMAGGFGLKGFLTWRYVAASGAAA